MTITEGTGTVEVVCPGVLDVLSIGKGDMRLTVSHDSPEETEKARKLIEDMMRVGYAIFVETDKGLTRVKRFNPRRMHYVIVEEVPPPAEAEQPKRGRPRTKEKSVPVAGSKATAVGRTAGG